MSENIWESQLEINKICDKRIALLDQQLSAVTALVIRQGELLQELAKLAAPTPPADCTAKHCTCDIGEM
jgi:hypothetical protein